MFRVRTQTRVIVQLWIQVLDPDRFFQDDLIPNSEVIGMLPCAVASQLYGAAGQLSGCFSVLRPVKEPVIPSRTPPPLLLC